MQPNQDDTSFHIPHVPDEIINELNRKKLAVFLGAGVSRIIGCQGWDEQSKYIVDECRKIIGKNGESVINEAQAKLLHNNFDSKKRMTICSDLLKRAGCEDSFITLIKNTLKADEDKIKDYDIYKELVKLRALFITTNFDEYFDKQFVPERIAYLPEEFIKKPDRNKLYKIHGTIENNGSLVCIVPEYLKQYNKDDFIKFLEYILVDYTILFIGYGLEEFELLDFIFTKGVDPERIQSKHYILQRIESHDEIDLHEAYYNQFGINVIPYVVNKDNKDYQLYHVIQNWATEADQRSGYMNESFTRIKEIIDDFDESSVDELFQYVKDDQSHKTHLFKILAETNNPLPWLNVFHERRCFSPDKNPSPVDRRVPYWRILGYLENVAKVNSNTTDENSINLLIQIIDDFVDFQNKIEYRIDNNYTDRIITKIIFLLPTDKIKDDYFDFVRFALKTKWDTIFIAHEFVETIFPKLIEQHAISHILKLLDIIFDYYQPKEKIFEDYVGRIEPFWLHEILSKNKIGLAQLCSYEAANIALQKVNEICEKDSSQFDNIWISAIEREDKFYSKDRYDREIIGFVRDMLERCEIDKIKEIVPKLIYCDHPIFNRIAIHIINHHYSELNEMFWNLDYNPLGKDPLKHECQMLLDLHNSCFNDEQISQFIEWVEDDIYYIPDNPDITQEEKDRYLACSKLRWLFSFDKTENRDIAELYQKYRSICPYENLEPYGESEIRFFSGEVSSITVDEFSEMTNDQIVNYLVEFKEEDGIKKPSSRGLAQTFEEFIQNNAEKAITDISSFESIPFVYQNALLAGLNKHFKNSGISGFDKIQSFISTLIKSDIFWDYEMSNHDRMYRDQIVSSIGEFITNGIKSDTVFSDLNKNSAIVNILITLGENLKPYIREPDEYLDFAFIPPQQIVYGTMFEYIIKNNEWNEEIKQFIEAIMNSSDEESRDFFYTFGRYFSDLYYFDKEWVSEHISKIFNVGSSNWIVAFAGYLLRSNPTKEMFRLMKQHGNYSNAIRVFNNRSTIQQNLRKHICFGYVNGEDVIEEENSLILQYINKNNAEQILNLIDAIWHIGKDGTLDKSQKERIRQLWRYILDRFSDTEVSEGNKPIVATMFNWIVIFDEIDNEMFDWLKQSINIEPNLLTTEYLLAFLEKNPKKVGELVALYIKNEKIELYDKKDIKKIIIRLFDLGYSELANKICNLTLKRNTYFLQEIYESHYKNNDLEE